MKAFWHSRPDRVLQRWKKRCVISLNSLVEETNVDWHDKRIKPPVVIARTVFEKHGKPILFALFGFFGPQTAHA